MFLLRHYRVLSHSAVYRICIDLQYRILPYVDSRPSEAQCFMFDASYCKLVLTSLCDSQAIVFQEQVQYSSASISTYSSVYVAQLKKTHKCTTQN